MLRFYTYITGDSDILDLCLMCYPLSTGSERVLLSGAGQRKVLEGEQTHGAVLCSY